MPKRPLGKAGRGWLHPSPNCTPKILTQHDSYSTAIRAKVLSTSRAKGKKVHKVEILQTFKGGAEIDLIAEMQGADGKRKRKIVKVTSQFSRKIAYCTMILNRRKTYLLTGGIDVSNKELTADFCHWHALWKELTAQQRRGLKGIYGENCDCKVEPFCWGGSCDDKIDGCNGQENDHRLMLCRAQHSFCVKSGHQCNWEQTYKKADFKKCMGA